MTKATLNTHTLSKLPLTVAGPRYERRECKTGIVHLGVGAFHRAHQLSYIDDLLAAGDLRWGTVGASLRSNEVRDRLGPQDCLYTIVEKGSGLPPRVIGALHDVLVAPSQSQQLLAAMASPDVHIVTLTVTEKGYVSADGEDLDNPVSAAGYIAAALAMRQSTGLKPFTAISCDNLAGNGTRLQEAVLGLAEPGLADWIITHGAFPNAMVDRIVPATTDADIAAFAGSTGILDNALVCTEPYKQWVIENRFASDYPDFASVGVNVVDDVVPWETAKLRMLNGAHSALAYLGSLAGYDYVHQCVEEPHFRALVDALWDETATTLSPDRGPDIARYRSSLMTRFANSALPHRTRQIAIDGSQKLPQRLVAPIRERLAKGLDVDQLALAVAGWMRWQLGRDEQGQAFVVDDPLAARTSALLADANTASDIVGALLSVEEIFGTDLRDNPAFRSVLNAWMQQLLTSGSAATLARAYV